MRRRILVPLALVALGAALLVLALRDGAGPAAVPVPSDADAAGRQPAPAPAASLGGSSAASGGRAALPAPRPQDAGEEGAAGAYGGTGASLRGRLLLPDGEPASGAAVEAFGMTRWSPAVDPEDPRTPPAVRWETRSDARGRFSLPDPPRDGLTFVLRARYPGLPPLERANLPATPGRTRDLGDLRFTEGCTIHGTVSDPEGRPIPLGTVHVVRAADGPDFGRRASGSPLRGYAATTDPNGRFTLEQLPSSRMRLRAEAAGFAPALSAPIAGEPGAELGGVTLVLARSAALEGTVLAENRAPVAGALVELDAPSSEERRLLEELGYAGAPDIAAALETRSGQDGRFRLNVPLSSERIRLRVAAPGFWPRSLELGEAERRLPVELVLQTLQPITGVVTDARGQGVGGANVALLELRQSRGDMGDPAQIPAHARAATGADGGFALPLDLSRTRDRSFQAVAWAEGFAPARSEVLNFAAGREGVPIPPLRLTLLQGLEASGVVLDPGGLPAAGARVHLRRLFVQRGGAGRRVLVPETRRPGTIYRAATTGGDGRFAFGGLPAGDYRLEAYAAGASPADSPDFALLADPYEAVLQLAAASAIEGRLVGPLSDFGELRVTASSPHTDPLDASVGADGRFRLDALPPDTYELVVRQVDRAWGGAFSFGAGEGLARATVILDAGETESVTLVLDLSERASLAGTVRVNGAPARDFSIFLVPRDIGLGAEDPILRLRALSNRLWSAGTDIRGDYKFAAVDPGDYWLVVDRGGAWPRGIFDVEPDAADAGPAGIFRDQVSLNPGDSGRLHLDLLLGAVRGEVWTLQDDGQQAPARGGRVQLVPASRGAGIAEREVQVRRDGTFFADRLAAGAWILSARSGDRVQQDVRVTVDAGETTVVRCVLEARGAQEPRPIR